MALRVGDKKWFCLDIFTVVLQIDCSPNNKPYELQTMGKHKTETQQQKSPAEFFASNQAIAGFDNPGEF